MTTVIEFINTLHTVGRNNQTLNTQRRSDLHESSFPRIVKHSVIIQLCVLVQTSKLIVDWCLINIVSVSQVLDMIHAARKI